MKKILLVVLLCLGFGTLGFNKDSVEKKRIR
jgi:hypothetical protein